MPDHLLDLGRLQHGMSNRLAFTTLLTTAHFLTAYLYSWFFVLADWYGFLDRYAIRSGKHRVASMQKQWRAIKDGTVDALLIKPLMFYILYPYLNDIIDFSPLTSWKIGFLEWLYMSMIFSTSLFFIHGAMHYFPLVYKYVHKKHHTFHDTVSFAAQYSHPIEGLLSSLHIVFGILLVKPHFIVLLVFLCTTFIEITDAHCGYDVPWRFLFPWSDYYPWGCGARAHDYHHSHNIGMYGGGLFGLWDRLLGTDRDFQSFESSRRK